MSRDISTFDLGLSDSDHTMNKTAASRMTTILAWSLCAVSVAVAGAALGLHILSGGVDPKGVTDGWASRVLVVPLPMVMAALIAAGRPRNPLGWLLAGGITFEAIAGLLAEYALYGRTTAPGSLPATSAAIFLSTFIWTPAIAAFVLMVMLFPDGRLPSPAKRWRAVAAAALGSSLALMVSTALAPYPVASARPAGFAGLQNPLSGVGTALSDPIGALGGLLLVASAAGAMWALVLRFRRSRGAEREQIAWVVYAAWIPLALFVAHLLPLQLPIFVGPVAICVFAVAMAIAVLRHRLLDIHVVVSRTVVLVLLVLALGALYVAVVEEASTFMRGAAGAAPSVLATAAVAIALAPLHQLLQRTVNRLLFGDRGNTGAVMARVGQSIEGTDEPLDVLAALSETLVAALKLKGARIELGADPAADRPGEGEGLVTPLLVQGKQVGRVVAVPREGERLGAADHRLLSSLSPHLAIVVRAVQLGKDLQHSREQLVTAREDERRRIRRDLHDGLGPTLAGVAMQLEAAQALLKSDPPAAVGRLETTHAQVEAAIGDIRRLVDGLRPPALDELGLETAIRQQVDALSERGASSRRGLDILVESSGELRGLPAAVEVAAFRIAAEAVTNVVRHAQASVCTVRLDRDNDLRVEVTDDGRGMAQSRAAGMGLVSMRQRVAELGGTLHVESVHQHGTTVTAVLPLGAGAG